MPDSAPGQPERTFEQVENEAAERIAAAILETGQIGLRRNPRLNAWLEVLDNGLVRIYTGKLELGQGVRTAIDVLDLEGDAEAGPAVAEAEDEARTLGGAAMTVRIDRKRAVGAVQQGALEGEPLPHAARE